MLQAWHVGLHARVVLEFRPLAMQWHPSAEAQKGTEPERAREREREREQQSAPCTLNPKFLNH